MLTIDKLRVGVAGISIGTLRRGNPPIDRMAQQAALSQTTMQETPQNDSFPTAPAFNGVSDKLDMPYAPELNPTSFTVEMWAMVGGGTGYQTIVTSVGGSPLEGRKGYLFCVTPSRQWQFWLGNGEPRAFWRVLTGPKVIPSVWTHLAGAYNQHSRIMTFYVNGQEVGRQIDVQYQPNDRNPMRVGAGATEQLGASPCFFCGKIAEVHIWDRVLSPIEIEALSAQQSIEIQAEPITEIDSPESASVEQDIHGTATQPLLNKDTPTPDSSKQGTGTVPSVTPTPSKPNSEKPITPPVVEQPLALKQPSTVTSMSDPPSVLWQIGRPGQAGIPVPTGAWTQVYNYTISADPDPLNRPIIPSCLVPPSASKIPNSTSQLNIHFVLAEDYTEGYLVLCYDRYGSGEDNIFLDGQLIARTPGADKVQLKQTQIPLGVVFKGLHTLSITVSNSADSAHVIDYLQLQTFKPMLSNLTSQLLPSGNQPRSRGNQPASQNAQQAQGGQGGGLLGGLLSPVTGIVGQVAGGAGNPAELVGGLVGQVAGAAGNPAELVGGLAGQVAGAAGNATGLVGGLVNQVAGAAGNPAELVGGLAGQVAGAAGNPAELVGGLAGQVAGLAGGLPGQSAASSGNHPAGATALSVEVVAQLAGLVNQLSVLIAQLGQMLNQLGIANQSAAVGMLQPQQLAQLSPQQLAQLSPQQLAQVYAAAQQVPGVAPQVASPMAALSPQQLAQLHEAARQILGIVPQVPSPIAGLSPQQLAQVYAAAQQASGITGLSPQQLAQVYAAAAQQARGIASQLPPGMAALPPELLAQLYRLQG
ncbi:LamG domain-containing protein [Brasilonema octagenarum]|uniref:LamG-like jellyroll fold domain-containing protein n=1 Tax=Brasilonema octagenarum UFV-OR1 TaxID=417115 RepID=A0ABX1LYV1_9CYAN|nr:LamG domain-containing protein [Brasilonema octagenarum]NMF61385.1 hypothetical protein [Brasilonema octagenarum UFV-OR1]